MAPENGRAESFAENCPIKETSRKVGGLLEAMHDHKPRQSANKSAIGVECLVIRRPVRLRDVAKASREYTFPEAES